MLKDEEGTNEEDNVRLVLNQVAEKDVPFNLDSEIVFKVNSDDELVMTTKVIDNQIGAPTIATRRFSRFDLDNLIEINKVQSQRPSFSVTPNLSRRGSYNVRQDETQDSLSQLLSAKLEKRRLSIPKTPASLQSNGPIIEISHHK